jgi:RNA polymerase sigma factor (sigma-70 family)
VFVRNAWHRSGMSGWQKYLKKMRGVLSRRGRARDEIDDLMQDAVVRLLEFTEHQAAVREPEAVLVRTVQRLALNHDRDSHADLYSDEPVETLGLVDLGPRPEEVLAGEQCLEEMRKTLDAVNRRTREVFFMHRLHGLRYAQIAERMQMPVSTVEKHIARAMTVLLEKQRREMQGHD